MDELEKLAWLIAEEFVRAFENLELLGLDDEEPVQEIPLTRGAQA